MRLFVFPSVWSAACPERHEGQPCCHFCHPERTGAPDEPGVGSLGWGSEGSAFSSRACSRGGVYPDPVGTSPCGFSFSPPFAVRFTLSGEMQPACRRQAFVPLAPRPFFVAADLQIGAVAFAFEARLQPCRHCRPLAAPYLSSRANWGPDEPGVGSLGWGSEGSAFSSRACSGDFRSPCGFRFPLRLECGLP